MFHIVHLEDDGFLQEVLQISLKAANPDLKLKQFVDSDEMLTYTTNNIQDINLFILDVRVFGSMNGVEVAQKIRQLSEDVPIIITSAFQRPSSEVLSTLNCRWYPKPWHVVDITREMLSLAQSRAKKNDDSLLASIELIMPGLARRSLDKGQIMVFSIAEASTAHINTFFDHLHQLQLNWPPGKAYFGLYDFSPTLGLSLTPEFRKRAEEVIGTRPQLMWHHAFVLPSFPSYMIRPVREFIYNELAKSGSRPGIAVFSDGKSALNWLRSELAVPPIS